MASQARPARHEVTAIIAGGPSLTPDIVARVRELDCYVIVTNNTWRLAPDAHVLMAGDAMWWLATPRVAPLPEEFTGIRLRVENQPIPGVHFYRPRYTHGGNSALHAACYASDQRMRVIMLFGVDLRDDQLTHWHGKHSGGLSNPTANTFKRARIAWSQFAEEPKRSAIINCNPNSGLECFPRMTIDEAVNSL